MRRRRRTIAVYGLASFLATMLIAWGSLWERSDEWGPTNPSAVRWPLEPFPGWPAEPDRVSQGKRFGRTTTSASHGIAAYLRTVRSDPNVTWYNMIERRTGWPFRAMVRYEATTEVMQTLSPMPMSIWRRGVVMPAEFQTEHARTNRLPIQPLPLGFAGNMAFYGVVFVVLTGIVRWIMNWRAKRRWHRGLCGRCRYPMSGMAACPECGLAVPASLVEYLAAHPSVGGQSLPRRWWTWKRVAIGSLCLVLGLVTNIAIAIQCALNAPEVSTAVQPATRWISETLQAWPGPVPNTWPANPGPAETSEQSTWWHDKRLIKVERSFSQASFTYISQRFGFPWRALRVDHTHASDIDLTAWAPTYVDASDSSKIDPVKGRLGGVRIERSPGKSMLNRDLPTAIIPLGFAANTLTLAALWLPIVLAMLWVLRRVLTRTPQRRPHTVVSDAPSESSSS